MITVNKNKTKQGHGNTAEKHLAKKLKGRQSVASGAIDFNKGDITTEQFLIESKATVNESLGVKVDWLLKIAQEALEKNKKPALAIQFVTGNGRPIHNGVWVCIRLQDFEDYTAYLEEE